MIFFSLQHATEIFHIFSCFPPAIIPQRGGDSYLVFQFITKSGQCSCKIKFNIFVNFSSEKFLYSCLHSHLVTNPNFGTFAANSRNKDYGH